MNRNPYKVCYRVDSTNCSRTLLLYSGSESEAIENYIEAEQYLVAKTLLLLVLILYSFYL